ncbi:MAG: DUF5519 family protein [Actinomycetota bacterium]|nr:DUF5519 family protein [Actinomycetota bacterium]
MQEVIDAARRITEEVTSWPAVEAGNGPRGEFGFQVNARELGHLHGNVAAHFSFPKEIGLRLRDEGPVVDHPAFPGAPGPVARHIRDDEDILDVIAMMWINYDRIAARRLLQETHREEAS